VGTGGEGGDGEEEEGLGGEEGLVLLAGAAHVPGNDGGRGGAPRRSTPADRAARTKRGRGDIAAGDDVRDAPAPKRNPRGARVGKSGRHGVYELTGRNIRKATLWLTGARSWAGPATGTLISETFPPPTTPPGLTTRRCGGEGGRTRSRSTSRS